MAKQIEDLNWKKRILIISYENKNNNLFIKIEKFISDYKCELNDRNLEIIFLINANYYFYAINFVFEI